MNAAKPISGVAWENRLLNLLRHELAPSPTRWRASIRLCALCVLGTALISAYHIPGGQFIVLILFLVGMSDAATSRATLVSNVLGSIIGGSLGVLSMAAFMDQPWILFPVQAAIIAGGMYILRRSTKPVSILLFMVSFVVTAPEMQTAPLESFYSGMRVVLFQCVGIAVGTLGQMLWWPEDPAKLLLDDLAESLRSIEQACAREPGSKTEILASGSSVRSLRDSAARLARQLDYLRQAEAKDQWLRQRHTEQIKLITDIQLLVFAALEWEQRVTSLKPNDPIATDVAQRLAAIREECGRLRGMIEQRSPPGPTAGISVDPRGPTPSNASSLNAATADPMSSARQSSAALTGATPSSFPELDELEQLLVPLPETLGFLSEMKSSAEAPPRREPVGRPAFLNPYSPAAQLEAVHFGLKGALAASLCGFIYQALDWPQIATCVLTAVLVAQATVGSGLHKSALRFGGALLAGLAVLLVIGGVMPNLQSLASLVILSGILTFIASWIGTGSSRIAYLGAQMGITLYLVLLPGWGPTIELGPARDRLIGILLGIAVMTVVDGALWPVFTHAALRRKVAGLLRELAELLRLLAVGDSITVKARALSIHRGIAESITLQDELIFERALGDDRAQTERRVVLRAINRLQEVFLGVLELGREREATGNSIGAANFPESLRAQDERVAGRLTELAGLLEKEVHVRPVMTVASQDDIPRSSKSRSTETPNPAVPNQYEKEGDLTRRLTNSVAYLERDFLPLLPPADGAPISNTASPRPLMATT